MDTTRARQIINSAGTVEVLYQGTPVWLESIKDNNTIDVTDMNTNNKLNVPVYMLVEKSPV